MIQLPESVKALINHVSEEYHLKNLTNPSQVNTIQSLLKLETDVTSLYINLSFEEGPICYKIYIAYSFLLVKLPSQNTNGPFFDPFLHPVSECPILTPPPS